MTHRWLHMRLAAPMMSFGSVRIDYINPTDNLPRQSQLTGLLGNALGLTYGDGDSLQSLQDHIIYGAVAIRAGDIMIDDQNANLKKSDPMWTRKGPATRDGDSYGGAHQRRRSYLEDAEIAVVLRSGQGDHDTTRFAEALVNPARPIFIGRKSCLPTKPLFVEYLEAPSARQALLQLSDLPLSATALLPLDEGLGQTDTVADLRDWKNDIHLGERARRIERLN